ncbi:MAG TPA: peptide ABC transporter substrate-binding protein [Ktedonobacterales bacterium]
MRATSSGLETRGARATQSRSQRRAATLLALFGAVTLILGACNIGGAPSTGDSPLAADQTFTWPYVDVNGTMGHYAVLDPAQIITYKDLSLVSMIYTNLVTFSPTLGIQADAATYWDVDSTGTIYTFHLRPNMKFSDGASITASDFAYSLDRSLDPNLCAVGSARTYAPLNECAQVGAAHLNFIIGWDGRLGGTRSTMISNGDNANYGLNVIDPLTLRIRLTHPVRFFLQSLTYPTGDVVEKSIINKYPGGSWVDHLDQGGASGPFQVKSYGAGKVMTLVPNSNWEQAFGKHIRLSQVVRPVYTTIETQYSAYRGGANDYTDVSLSDYPFARGQTDFHDIVALETDYFAFNFKLAPFDNLQVRQALDLALNKQLLVDSQEKGGAVPTNHIVPQGMPGYFPALTNPPLDGTQSLTGNSSAAQHLLSVAQSTCPAAGLPGPDYCPYIFGSSPKEIDLYVPADQETQVSLAQTAAAYWNQALNLNIRVKPVPFDTLVGYLGQPAAADPMQMWLIGWIADYPDPQDWLTIQFETNGPDNSEGISERNLDKIMQAADIESDPVKRMQMYNQAEQIAVNEVAWLPFQQAKLAWRLRQYVRGFAYNGLGVMVDLSWPNVYIAAH